MLPNQCSADQCKYHRCGNNAPFMCTQGKVQRNGKNPAGCGQKINWGGSDCQKYCDVRTCNAVPAPAPGPGPRPCNSHEFLKHDYNTGQDICIPFGDTGKPCGIPHTCYKGIMYVMSGDGCSACTHGYELNPYYYKGKCSGGVEEFDPNNLPFMCSSPQGIPDNMNIPGTTWPYNWPYAYGWGEGPGWKGNT